MAVAGALLCAPTTAFAQEAAANQWLDVEVGESIIYRQDRPFSRILISNNEVAEIKQLEEDQFQVRGLTVGTTDLWVWYRDDRNNPVHYDLTVHRDLSDLVRRVEQQVESTEANVRVYPLLERIVLEGEVTSVEMLEQLSGLGSIYDENFINLLTVTGDHQVQLEVIFAEVNRSALRTLGFNGLWGSDSLGAALASPESTTAKSFVTLPGLSTINQGLVGTPRAGAFDLAMVGGGPLNVSAIMSVLERNQLSKVLARPTLVALSGQQAEFLSGGEIPLPANAMQGMVSITFREYGIKVVFVPTVLGQDVIDLRVYVEVSEVDTTNSINVSGLVIPGLLARKSASHLRLESGKTFAMAGLLSDDVRYTNQKVPLLGDIPIVGTLFRSIEHTRSEQELMIFVTPKLVRPMAADEVPQAPGITQDNNPTDFELFMLGLDHRVGSNTAEATGPIGPIGLER